MRSLIPRSGLLFCLVLALMLVCVAISKQLAWSSAKSARVWTASQNGSKQLSFGENQAQPMPMALPPLPFTVEIVARYSKFSADAAIWGILLNVFSERPSAVLLTNDRHYFAPASDFATFFYGLHLAGQFNQIRLSVDINKQATLDLNSHVVWRGVLFFDPNPGRWALFAANSYRHTAVITWLKVDLYQPLSVAQ